MPTPDALWSDMTGGSAPRVALDRTSAFASGPIRWLVFCGVVLIAAVVAGTAIMVSNFRGRALDNSKSELGRAVLLLARHFDQQFGEFAAAEQDLITYLQSIGIDTSPGYQWRMAGIDIHLMLASRVGSTPHVGTINLLDSDGALINSSAGWPVPTASAADSSYFRAFKSDPHSPSTLVALERNQLTGAATLVFARKMTARNGDFIGVVSRSIEVSYFERFLASVALGQDAVIAMFHQDGTVLAHHPRLDSVIGPSFGSRPMFRHVLLKGSNTAELFTSPLDGDYRVGASRILQGFPIVVVATTTVSAALADWRQQTRFLVGAATLSALVIASILFLIVRQLSRQHDLERRRLATAVNNMQLGLLLFDSAHRLVVCNQRYLEMFELSADIVKPGCSLRELIAHRKATGTLKEDVDEHCAVILRNVALNNALVTETADGRAIQIAYRMVAGGGWVCTFEDITQRRRAETRIAHLAHYDSLTDLANRVLFRDRLEQRLKRIGDTDRFALLLIDIDEFKGVNDSLGHAVGDELLKSVAARLRACVDDADAVARLGGDEFAIVHTIHDTTEVTELVRGIYASMRQPHDCLGHQVSVDASIGIAIAPKDGCELDQVVSNADLAMYEAKSDGRRTFRFFAPEMERRAKARRVLEQELRQIVAEQAFAKAGLEVHYQPLISLRDNHITGCEALLRWPHPERGMIAPSDFIPVAEETGLVAALGEWVLATACAEAVNWPAGTKVAVNVSPVQFRSQMLPLQVAAALASSGLHAGRLELEITEAVLIRDDEATLAIMEQLRSIGVRIALDDFGTGYSSLSYLQRFPFDKIKIDRCFVSDIAKPDGSSSIVQAVVTIAGERRITTTAEGVETEEQRQLLCALGCSEMQGYLFSPAQPAASVRTLLAAHQEKYVAA